MSYEAEAGISVCRIRNHLMTINEKRKPGSMLAIEKYEEK